MGFLGAATGLIKIIDALSGKKEPEIKPLFKERTPEEIEARDNRKPKSKEEALQGYKELRSQYKDMRIKKERQKKHQTRGELSVPSMGKNNEKKKNVFQKIYSKIVKIPTASEEVRKEQRTTEKMLAPRNDPLILNPIHIVGMTTVASKMPGGYKNNIHRTKQFILDRKYGIPTDFERQIFQENYMKGLELVNRNPADPKMKILK